MRIVFICGSLESGKDGVGDYVRRLSAELIGLGHAIAMIAINDKHISTIKGELVNAVFQEGEVSVLRLPNCLDEKERFRLVKTSIESLNPDWLSLQFVPFSFQSKGLVFGLAEQLATAGRGRKWHIMFHELWVGMASQSNQKEKVWGMIQKQLIKNLIRRLSPAVIHTHTTLYKIQLETLNVKAVLLPLFSNIPLSDTNSVKEKLAGEIQKTNKVRVILFGGIQAAAPVEELAKEAEQYALKHQLCIELVVIGRNGTEQERWLNAWVGSGLSSIVLGEVSAEEVSTILTQEHYGIFTTPIALVEKSGSVAAMREHGLHLLCVSRKWDPRGITIERNPFSILNYTKGNLESFFNSKPDFSFMPALSMVSQQFVSNLKMIK